MPIVPSSPVYTQPVTTQMNLGRMIGRILNANPDVSPTLARSWLNDAYRRIQGVRHWYGMMQRGQVVVPNVYTTGSVSVTLGSAVVTGVGTAFTTAMIGLQFRSGFTTGFYNVLSVQNGLQLTLDQPWGGPSGSNLGFQILQNLVTLGSGIKFVTEMVNQRQGWRMRVNVPQVELNQFDTWRVTTGWTYWLANREPSTAGNVQYELYPSPTFQQTFPFLAYAQPPDMVADADFPYLYIRSDVVVLPALAEAKTHLGPKVNKYYDENKAMEYERRFVAEIEKMMRQDDDMYTKDMQSEYWKQPYGPYGSVYAQSHDVG